jgi:hypothetical protein
MSNPYLASALIADVKRRGFIPDNNTSYTAADLLAWMTAEVQTYIAALLKGVRQEFLVTSQDIAFTADTVQIPTRAVANGLRTVKLLVGGAESPLEYIEPERTWQYGTGLSTPVGYTLRGSALILVGCAATVTGTLRVSFMQRPSICVGSTAAGQISAINTGTKTVTLQSVEVSSSGVETITAATMPTTFTTSATYDFVRGTSGFDNLALNQAVTATGTGTLTFSSALPTGLAVGDWVSLAGETPIPQIPVELHPLLAQRVTVKLAEATGSPRLKEVKAMLDEQRKDAVMLLQPRVGDAVHLIVRRDGPMPIRGGRTLWRR